MINSVKNGSDFNFLKCLLILLIFNWQTTLDKLVITAARKSLFLIMKLGPRGNLKSCIFQWLYISTVNSAVDIQERLEMETVA